MAWDFETEPEFEQKRPPGVLVRTTAERDERVINGHKWFTTNGPAADFLVVMCATNPIVHPCQQVEVPTEHVPTRWDAARKRFAWLLDQAAVST